jgi:hypothetical protein
MMNKVAEGVSDITSAIVRGGLPSSLPLVPDCFLQSVVMSVMIF